MIFKRHSDVTLMKMTKKEMVKYVRMCEHNREVAEQSLEQHIENMKDWKSVRHGHWILTKRTKLIPTDKIGIKESFITCRNNTVVNENNINKKAFIIKKRITITKPKCSGCGYCGYDEDDITLYCPNCGAKMDIESEE